MRLRIFYIAGLLASFCSPLSVSALTFEDVGNAVGNVIGGTVDQVTNGGQSINVSAPDLVIDTVTFWGDQFPLAISVKNQGGLPSVGATQVKIEWIKPDGTVRNARREACVPVLLAGGTVACLPELSIPRGVNKVRVTVNPPGTIAIPEGNIDNNSGTYDIPPEPLPDLIVTDLRVDEDRLGSQFNVKNVGTRSVFLPLGTALSPRMRLLNANGTFLAGSSRTYNLATICQAVGLTLNPGDSVACGGPALPNAAVRLEARVNEVLNGSAISRPIRESNTGNNGMEIVLPAVKYSDVVVQSVSIDPDTRVAVAKIKNEGTRGVQVALPIPVQYQYYTASGRRMNNSLVPCFTLLGIGESVDCTLPALPNAITRITVTVDSLNVLSEVKTGNNTLKVNAPKPLLPDLSLESVKLDEYDGPHLVTVKNVGTRDYKGSSMTYAVRITDASGKELPALPNKTPLSFICFLPGDEGGLKIGETKTCEAKFLMGSAARKVKFTLAAVRVGSVLNYQGEELDTANNSLTVNVPPPKFPDLVLESITFTGDEYAQMKVKNIGTRVYTSDALVFAATVTTAAGRELVALSKSLVSQVCTFDDGKGATLGIGESRTCALKLLFSDDARKLKVTLAAVKVGTVTNYLGEELSRANNSLTVDIPVKGKVDLELTSISFQPDGKSVLTVKNVGTKTYSSDSIAFAAIVKDAAGRELVAGTSTLTPNTCLIQTSLPAGTSQTCFTNLVLGNDAKQLTISLAAMRVGTVTNFLGEEMSTVNNTKTVDVPAMTGSFDVKPVSVTWGENDFPTLKIKNEGTLAYTGNAGTIPMAITVKDANGAELPLSSLNMVAEPCFLTDTWGIAQSIQPGAEYDCHLRLVMNDAAKSLTITVNAIKAGTGLSYFGNETNTQNNTITVPVQTGLRGIMTGQLYIDGAVRMAPNYTVQLKALKKNADGTSTEYTDGIWSLKNNGQGTIDQTGKFKAGNMLSRTIVTVLYTYTDENGVWTEVSKDIIVE